MQSIITIQYSLHVLPAASTWPEDDETDREVTSVPRGRNPTSSFRSLDAPSWPWRKPEHNARVLARAHAHRHVVMNY